MAVNRVRLSPDKRTRTSAETENFLKLVNRTAKYRDGAYVNVTYFQIIDTASSTDVVLDNVFDNLTNTSPLKYRKIEAVPMYGVDTLQITTQYNDAGLTSMINQDGEFQPDTVVPVAGDFFEFDLPQLKGHLFQITDVQFAYTGPSKFYKVQWSIYNKNTDAITNNVSEECELQIDHVGSELNSVLTKKEAIIAGDLQTLVDALIDRYTEDYYDEATNSFVFRASDGKILWSSYLQHFLAKNKVLTHYRKKLMDCIYLLDINKFDFPSVYDEKKYRRSIFNAVEMVSNTVAPEMSYAFKSNVELRMRNLPFFAYTDAYCLLDMGENVFSFPFTLKDYDTGCFATADEGHKFITAADFENTDKYNNALKPGDILYQSDGKNNIIPKDIYYVDKDGTLQPALLNDMLDSKEGYSDLTLFDIVRKYIQKELVITKELIEKLNTEFYDTNVQNYIYIPLVIYILQRKTFEMLKK